MFLFIAKRLQGLHKHIGINQSDLSEEARKAIEDTVTMAVNLDLKDCSYTRYYSLTLHVCNIVLLQLFVSS